MESRETATTTKTVSKAGQSEKRRKASPDIRAQVPEESLDAAVSDEPRITRYILIINI
jgi:hypothetical protein